MRRLNKQLPSYIQVELELRNRFPIGKFTFGHTDPRVPGKALGAIALWEEIQRAFREFEEGTNDGLWLVSVDSGGYDPNGTYFGAGERLYWCASADGEVDFMLRAAGREEAKAKVLGRYPQGRFFR